MKSIPFWLIAAFRLAIIVLLPVVLILTNVRLMMSIPFLNYEYHKPDLTPDAYGFTQADRLTYAPIALDYLLNNQGIEFLGQQTFPDGSPQYNSRELKHMEDVKRVTRSALVVWELAGLIVITGAAALWLTGNRMTLRGALIGGAGITLLIFLSIIAYIAINFDTFFIQFHNVFFESGTWLFLYSDTLIRLFPEVFWQDAFTFIVGGAIAEALLIGAAAWWGVKS